MPPRDTIWAMDEHTRGKHLVLRYYLDAWMPILGQTGSRILFIDGFAGPGKYLGGEDGSPIIALRAFHEHPARARMRAEVVFLFIEQDQARADHLRRLIEGAFPPAPRTRIHVECADFEPTLRSVVEQVEGEGDRLAPSFVMVDPFGVKGFSMELLGRILGHPRSELYVTFMWDAIERFLGAPEFADHLTAIYGVDSWMEALALTDTPSRKRFLFDLYKSRLREAGATDVLHFELYRGGNLVYAIFFATQHRLGANRMKQAIWRVAPFGDFTFRGLGRDQLSLELAVTDTMPFRQHLRDFAGDRWTTIEDLEDFAMSDATPFHSSHLKQKTLVPMEREGLIEVRRPEGRRGFVEGTVIRFR